MKKLIRTMKVHSDYYEKSHRYYKKNSSAL